VNRAWTRLAWTAEPASGTERPGKASFRSPVQIGEKEFLLRPSEAEPEKGAGGLRVAVRRCGSKRKAFGGALPANLLSIRIPSWRSLNDAVNTISAFGLFLFT